MSCRIAYHQPPTPIIGDVDFSLFVVKLKETDCPLAELGKNNWIHPGCPQHAVCQTTYHILKNFIFSLT